MIPDRFTHLCEQIYQLTDIGLALLGSDITAELDKIISEVPDEWSCDFMRQSVINWFDLRQLRSGAAVYEVTR